MNFVDTFKGEGHRPPSLQNLFGNDHSARRRLRFLLLKSPLVTFALAIFGVAFLSLEISNFLFRQGYESLVLRSFVSKNDRELHGTAQQIFVIAGGAPRTGSTFIFNILRILMRIRDPNTVASSNWMIQKLVPEDRNESNYDRIAQLRTLGTSILVKVHTAHQYYEFAGPANKKRFSEEVDVLYTSHRDLREETVSAYKMFVMNRSAFAEDRKWGELCQSLIRRRNSLISEAGTRVPVYDIRYEDWKNGSDSELLTLIRRLAAGLRWHYSESDLRGTLLEIKQLRVPVGGPAESRVNWHLSNLMSPRHISMEHLDDGLIMKGTEAVENEPVCNDWLRKHGYIS